MTEKQKIAAAIGIVFLAAAFVFLWKFVSCCRVETNQSEKASAPVSMPIPAKSSSGKQELPTGKDVLAPVSSTPDSVTDDILKNDSDSSALDRESSAESAAASSGAAKIDSITNSYDEQPQ